MLTDLEPTGINGRYECSRLKSQKVITQMRLAVVTRLVFVLITGSVAVVLHASPPVPGVQTEKSVEALALEWYANMQTGQIIRAQLAPEYNAQLTDDLVQATAKHLKEYAYGASPTGAQVIKTRTIGEQTFYIVKIVFPRGDAASLMFGFNAEGKITGISLMSMAGD
jgi:hypothetical protein